MASSVKLALNTSGAPQGVVQGAPAPLMPESVVTNATTTKPQEGSAPVQIRIQVRNLNFYYGKVHALHNINLDVAADRVTALIGPSGCGKSTLLRTLNRMYETVRHTRLEGEIRLNGEDILSQDVTRLRRRVGMVFQRPNPFPKSIFDNVAYGLRVNGLPFRRAAALAEAVEHSLRRAALWDEVKDQLHRSAYALSGGQQQRLCIARALAVDPEVLLLDEPCSALDPVNTAKIEELLFDLKSNCTLVIVTHNMQQAARVSDSTAFLLNGDLVEFTQTSLMFTKPTDPRTEAYITGRFG
jgi:phosphate transport system ATP-binding protein